MTAASLLVLSAGCDDKKTSQTDSADEADAGANAALVDKNIQNAVKSVAQAPSAAQAVAGPPPTGVFGPGEADKAHAANAPPKIEMVERGSEPRVKLRPALAGAEKVRLTVLKNYAQQVFLSIDYTLSAKVTGGGVLDGAAPEGADDAPAGPLTLVLTVDKLQPSAPRQGMPAMPAEIGKKLQELKGTTLSMPLSPSGAAGVETIKLPKKGPPAGDTLANMALGGLAEMVSFALPAWPDEPVGQGAYWVANDRAVVSGVPVVRYRVTRIEKIVGDEVTYSVELRQYAVDGTSLPTGVPANLSLMAFQAQGKAAATRKVSALWPSAAKLQSPIVMQLANAQQPQRVAPMQIDTQAQLVSGAAAPKK